MDDLKNYEATRVEHKQPPLSPLVPEDSEPDPKTEKERLAAYIKNRRAELTRELDLLSYFAAESGLKLF